MTPHTQTQRHLLFNGGLTDYTNQEHIHAVPAKQLARHIILNLSTATQIKLNPMAAWQATKYRILVIKVSNKLNM